MQYEIKGGAFPVVVCKLTSGEVMVTEKGSMVWMTPNIEMNTVGGGIGKMFGRLFTGEKMFQNVFTAQGNAAIAFGSSFPGRILPISVAPGADYVFQKNSFLASEQGVELSVHFNKKLGAGLFGGEGFIMQKVSGNGMAFIEVDGDLIEYTLTENQEILVNTGSVLGFESTVKMDIQRVKGAKNVLFGGEGLFHTRLTGPGKIWIQTMPISKVANAVIPFLPTPTTTTISTNG